MVRKFLFVGVCLAVGFISSIFTINSIPTWYATINKPWFTPPSWIFGPAWTILYILMGVSAGLVRKTNRYFVIQLILNFFWSFIFFYLHQPLLAFIEIIFLWIFIALTIKDFKKTSKLAAALLLPYILWVTFAATLNLAVTLLNL